MKRKIEKTIAIYLQKNANTQRQEQLCQEYCHLRFGKDVETVFYREDTTERKQPALQAMLEAAKRHAFYAIICAELAAMCYSSAELCALLDTLSKCKVGIVAIADQFDSFSPLGRVMIYTLSMLDVFERKGAARRVRDGMLELSKTGRWLGGVTPTGYHSLQLLGEDGTKQYALEPLPNEEQVVRRIYETFLACNSLTEVEHNLKAAGIKTKNGREYSRFSIRQILENPVYMLADPAAWKYFSEQSSEICSLEAHFDGSHGLMVYNKTMQQSGKAAKLRDPSQWIVAVGQHKGFVSGADWVQAQQQLEQNKSGGMRKPKSELALLSGLLYCADCGAYMRPKQTQRLTEDGQPSFIYLCERKERSKSTECHMRNVSGNQLDQIVCAQLQNLPADSPALLAQLANNQQATRPVLDQDELTRLEEGKAELESLISDLVFSLVKTIDKSAYNYIIAQIDELHQDNSVLQARIDELRALAGTHPMVSEEIAAMRDILRNFQEQFDTSSLEKKRAALRALIERVVWNGSNVRVFLYGAQMDEIDLDGNANS